MGVDQIELWFSAYELKQVIYMRKTNHQLHIWNLCSARLLHHGEKNGLRECLNTSMPHMQNNSSFGLLEIIRFCYFLSNPPPRQGAHLLWKTFHFSPQNIGLVFIDIAKNILPRVEVSKEIGLSWFSFFKSKSLHTISAVIKEKW